MSKKTKSVAVVSATNKVNIGISTDDRATIAKALSEVLADSYTLYLMTHNFHWNVTGQWFNTLHAMFMTQYTEQWTALDGIAERIRALGHPAPGTYREYSKLSSIEEPIDIPLAPEMVRLLVNGNEAVATTARRAYEAANNGKDQPSTDLLTRRMDIHEKNAWMLRSLLE